MRFMIIIAFLLVGCMGPPADHVTPDNSEKADPVLVQEFREAFGEFGKEDAKEFGGLYLAYADLILTETKCKTTGDALSWLVDARELLKMQSYPGFKEAVVRETSKLQENAALDEEYRKKIAAIFRRLGLAAQEAGR